MSNSSQGMRANFAPTTKELELELELERAAMAAHERIITLRNDFLSWQTHFATLTPEVRELEFAARALRQNAVEEFRVRRDSTSLIFYRSMVLSSKPFRVVWDGKVGRTRISAPSETIYLPPNPLLREKFGQHLNRFCEELVELMEWLIEHFVRIRYDIDWIDQQVGKIFPLLDKEYPTWTQVACNGRPADHDWCAPAWLDRWPVEIPPDVANRGGCLNPDQTAKVLEGIGTRIKERLVRYRTIAMKGLRVRFAQENDAARRTVNAVLSSSSSSPETWDGSDVKRSKNAEEPTTAIAAGNAKGISRAPTKDAEADSGIAKESMVRKSKRGPKANMKFQCTVAEVVHSFGLNWEEHLEHIALTLDKRKIPSLQNWAMRGRAARSWLRAVEYYPYLVRKAFTYSLKMASKDTIEKPQQTLANLR